MRMILALVALSVAAPAVAQGYHIVQGYTRSDGTYVAPHYQTNPDGNVNNNWSTQGNVNPFTGRPGTVNPYGSPNPYGGSQRGSDASNLGNFCGGC